VWYGGGPAISCVGPPIEDTRRWTVHVYERIGDEKPGENLIELVSKLEHPEDIVHKETKDGSGHIAVKLRQGRRVSVAELQLLSKTADFHDGEGDKAEKALSVIGSSDEEAEENDSDEEDGGQMAPPRESLDDAAYPTLTATQLALLNASHDEDNEDHSAPRSQSSAKAPAPPAAAPAPPKGRCLLSL
jgi:hypothetical protein